MTEYKSSGNDLKVRIFPDPVLKAPAAPVEDFGSELASFVEKLRATMELHEGAGLAAPQVGILKKIAIVAFEGTSYVLINPKVLEQDGEQNGDEGCLSFPGIYAPVKRPNYLKVSVQDVTGAEHIIEVQNFFARAFLHEMDHLEGKLFIEHLSMLKRGMIRKKMLKRAADEE